MTTIEIISIIIIHWLADFVLQTDEMAKGKSTSNTWLLKHTASYSIIWVVVGAIIYPVSEFDSVMQFGIITLITHTITDYFTSRLNSKLWKEGKVHQFFVSIGFDQVLHYAQLFITYQILFRQ